MPRHPDPYLLRHACLDGAARGIEDAVFTAPPDAVQRSRDELSRLWAAIDRLLDALHMETGATGFRVQQGE